MNWIEWWSLSWRNIKAPVCNITSSWGIFTWPYILSVYQPQPKAFAERKANPLGQHSLVSIWRQWVVHVFHISLMYPRWFFWMPFPPNHTLNFTYQLKNKKCLLFGLHAPSSSHVGRFGAVCVNNNPWNATMSHSKVSFKAHCQPPPYQPPHFLTAK